MIRHKRVFALILLWLGPSLLLLGMTAAIHHHYKITEEASLSPTQREGLLRCLRHALEPDTPLQEASLPDMELQLVVRAYYKGQVYARFAALGASGAQVCMQLRAQMASSRALQRLSNAARSQVRLAVDRVIGEGPVLERPELLATMSLHPGVDGYGAKVGERKLYLLPSEVSAARLLVSNRPLPFVRDFVFGFDRKRAALLLRRLSSYSTEQWKDASFFRFRSESFAERNDGTVLPLLRDQPPSPEPNARNLRDGAIEGGRYLVRHLAKSGRFIYLADLASGRQSNPGQGAYSLPRHAGTTYFLAELYRHTREEFLLEPIERAIGHLADLVQASQCEGQSLEGARFVCVADRNNPRSDLGSTALAVVALAEYQRATGSDRFERLMREMGEFLLYMQREDGSFNHRYFHQEGRIDTKSQLLYYSGEASLALARLHKVTGEERYLQATEAALDWLVNWYDFFLGGFFFGEEHWTCIAAEAASPELRKDKYWRFCRDYGAFLRRNQLQPGDFVDQGQWAGAYYFTPFLAPQNTPAGSRSEAMISTYELGLAQGEAEPALFAQIMAAMRYSLRQQIRQNGLYRVPESVQGLGGIPGGPIDWSVRIDYVQHVCSAMIRSASLLEKLSSGENPSQVIGSEP